MTSSIDEVIAASLNGELPRVTTLVDEEPQLAGATNMLGSSAIHAAHFANHPEVVSFLVSRGRALDGFLLAELGLVNELRQKLKQTPSFAKEVSSSGLTALHGACYWGSIEASRLLLEHGADPNAVTQDTFLQIHPLGCAVATPDIPNPSQDEIVVLKLVDVLLDHGANVNGRRRDGMTALHSAAYRGLLKVARRLVERGADPTIRALDGTGPHARQLPIDTATAQNQQQIVEYLRSLQ